MAIKTIIILVVEFYSWTRINTCTQLMTEHFQIRIKLIEEEIIDQFLERTSNNVLT